MPWDIWECDQQFKVLMQLSRNPKAWKQVMRFHQSLWTWKIGPVLNKKKVLSINNFNFKRILAYCYCALFG